MAHEQTCTIVQDAKIHSQSRNSCNVQSDTNDGGCAGFIAVEDMDSSWFEECRSHGDDDGGFVGFISVENMDSSWFE